jgi:hypothetical protein
MCRFKGPRGIASGDRTFAAICLQQTLAELRLPITLDNLAKHAMTLVFDGVRVEISLFFKQSCSLAQLSF